MTRSLLELSALIATVGVLVGCGGSTPPSPGTTTAASTTTAVAPAKVRLSPAARQTALRACRTLAPGQALRRFLSRARAAQADHDLPARRALIAQATHLAAPSAPVQNAVPVAAALYATTRPSADRASAFQGCSAALRQHHTR